MGYFVAQYNRNCEIKGYHSQRKLDFTPSFMSCFLYAMSIISCVILRQFPRLKPNTESYANESPYMVEHVRSWSSKPEHAQFVFSKSSGLLFWCFTMGYSVFGNCQSIIYDGVHTQRMLKRCKMSFISRDCVLFFHNFCDMGCI